jgi:hypothetical protein
MCYILEFERTPAFLPTLLFSTAFCNGMLTRYCSLHSCLEVGGSVGDQWDAIDILSIDNFAARHFLALSHNISVHSINSGGVVKSNLRATVEVGAKSMKVFIK